MAPVSRKSGREALLMRPRHARMQILQWDCGSAAPLRGGGGPGRYGTQFAKPTGMSLFGIPVFCITTVLLLALAVRDAR